MSPSDRHIVVVGAGPYGLAAAFHLRRAGIEASVFGDPMSFWRGMPKGMLLRSNWGASNIAELTGDLTLDAFQAHSGNVISYPIPLECFVDYGTWFQEQAIPDIDPRSVTQISSCPGGFRVELEDGEEVRARRVVVAAGIASFPWRPPSFRDLPLDLVSHTSDHRDLGRFSGRKILVVGGGQSALESAALLREGGASVEVLVRAERLTWLSGGWPQRRLGRFAPLLYAPTDVGPGGLSRLVAAPDLFRRMPRRWQTRIAARAIRPAGARWLLPRLENILIRTARRVASAARSGGGLRVRLDDGTVEEVDHLLFGTGYRVDLSRYAFLPPALLARVERIDGYPLLSAGLESTVPGLHFLGAPAAWSFGPVMRFVSGSWFGGQALTRAVVAASSGRNGSLSRAGRVGGTEPSVLDAKVNTREKARRSRTGSN